MVDHRALACAILAQVDAEAAIAPLPDPLPVASSIIGVVLIVDAEPAEYSARAVTRSATNCLSV